MREKERIVTHIEFWEAMLLLCAVISMNFLFLNHKDRNLVYIVEFVAFYGTFWISVVFGGRKKRMRS